jgi:hypothetical protein
MVLTIVNVLVMWRVVVTTEAEGPDPRVKVATVASTVVLISTSSPLETVVLDSDQSDQVSVDMVGLTATWLGKSGLDVAMDWVVASTGELPIDMVDSQSDQVASLCMTDEDVVSAATSLELVVDGRPCREVVEVLTFLTSVSLLAVMDIQSDQVMSLPFGEEEEVEMTCTGSVGVAVSAVVVLLVLVLVLVLVSEMVTLELVAMSLTGASELVVDELVVMSLTGASDVVVDMLVVTSLTGGSMLLVVVEELEVTSFTGISELAVVVLVVSALTGVSTLLVVAAQSDHVIPPSMAEVATASATGLLADGLAEVVMVTT